MGKQTRQVFSKGVASRSERPLELVHADLIGPMQTLSLGGNVYVFLVTDDHSRYSWAYFLANKSDALNSFKNFKALAEKQLNIPLKALRTDGGGEFTSGDFRRYCELHGIKQQHTAPYSPQQNWVAERKNRTVVEMARSMLKEMNIPIILWANAVVAAVHLLNRSPSNAINDLTPYEVLNGKRPSITHLRVFGCVAYVLVDSKLRRKFDSKTRRCVFVGYCEDAKAYRLFDPETKKITISRNLCFFEDTP